MKPIKTDLLAVYGTLRRGFYNHYLLGEEPKLVWEGFIDGVGLYFHQLVTYPRAAVTDGAKLFVEVYRVEPEVASQVAALELAYGYRHMEVSVPGTVEKATLWVDGSRDARSWRLDVTGKWQ